MKTIKILMMMISALVVCSCSDDDDYADAPEDDFSGFYLGYEKSDIYGQMSACSEAHRPAVMYDSCCVEYSKKELTFNYRDGREESKSCYMLALICKELGNSYADSLMFSPDSTSFTAEGYYNYVSKKGAEQSSSVKQIPARFYSYDLVEGKPVKVAVEFVHPDFGKTEYVFYRYPDTGKQ